MAVLCYLHSKSSNEGANGRWGYCTQFFFMSQLSLLIVSQHIYMHESQQFTHARHYGLGVCYMINGTQCVGHIV